MNQMYDDMREVLAEDNNPSESIMPAHLGTIEYKIVPIMIAEESVRFLPIPPMKKTGLTIKQSAVFGFLHVMARITRVDGQPEKRTMTRAQYRSALTPDRAKLFGLKKWSETTRSRYRKAFMTAGLMKKCGNTLVFTFDLMTERFWKLPYAILARPDMTITNKVIWAALVFMASNTKVPANEIGFVPWRSSLAQELGRSVSETTKHMSKGFASVHLNHFRKIGLVRIVPGRSLHSHMSAYMVPLEQICNHSPDLLTGDLDWACAVWQKKLDGQETISLAQRRNAIAQLYHRDFKRLRNNVDAQRMAPRANVSADNRKEYYRALTALHHLARKIMEEISVLIQYAVTAEDLMFLGFDDSMEITLCNTTLTQRHLYKHFREYPAAKDMLHSDIVKKVGSHRMHMEQMLWTGVKQGEHHGC